MALLPNRNVLDGTKVPVTTTSEAKTAFGQIIDFLTAFLGTDSANKAAARASLQVAPISCVRGLVGNVNATSPLTKYDLSADKVVLSDANGATLVIYNTGTLTCDLGLAGPVANGRDQAAAFLANSWVHLYIAAKADGTKMAIASATAPNAFNGSTLPAGYTFWCYATTLRWNGSSNIIPVNMRGAFAEYDVASGGIIRVLNSGTATSMTPVSCASVVPPNNLRALLGFYLGVSHGSASEFAAFARATGSTITGKIVADVATSGASIAATNINTQEFTLNASQQFDYRLNVSPGVSGGLSVDVYGYYVPNGDS